jgi:electron transport complex protein RnfD
VSPARRRLLLHSAPFLRTSLSTPRLMVEVCLCLVPILAAAMYFFGLAALLVVAAAVAGAVLTEWWFAPRPPRGESLRDGSAVLTGVLLGLVLPPCLPLWMAFLGGAVGIGLGKLVWGGLGHNLFNPALVGRAFLPAPCLALPFTHVDVDGVSGATPLAAMKFEHLATPLQDLLLGNTSGSLGETSALLLILCGLWLGLRRAYEWRIPVAVLLGVALLGGVLHLVDPSKNPVPWFHLLSGGLLFGTVFMATDPVSSPTTPRGAWSFGLGIGFLVVLIRNYGGLPEGVMYAILLMNGAVPLIERVAQPRPFGRKRAA